MKWILCHFDIPLQQSNMQAAERVSATADRVAGHSLGLPNSAKAAIHVAHHTAWHDGNP
jgi:hypothetical protein